MGAEHLGASTNTYQYENQPQLTQRTLPGFGFPTLPLLEYRSCSKSHDAIKMPLPAADERLSSKTFQTPRALCLLHRLSVLGFKAHYPVRREASFRHFSLTQLVNGCTHRNTMELTVVVKLRLHLLVPSRELKKELDAFV